MSEPHSWSCERKALIQVLQNGLFEECFSLLQPYPDVFVSLFEINDDGNVDFSGDVHLSDAQTFGFATELLRLEKDFEYLQSLVSIGCFDSMLFSIFDRFGLPDGIDTHTLRTCSRRMVAIKAGVLWVDSQDEDEQDDNPRQSCRSEHDLLFSCYPVIQMVWSEVMGSNPSVFQSPTKPVENVCWTECIDFCNRLSEREGLQPVYKIVNGTIEMDVMADGYRVPTESEWEYAAMAGQHTIYAGGDGLDALGWYRKGRLADPIASRPPGQKRSNAWGIYDMSGNVKDWCWDSWRIHTEEPNETLDLKCVRGGSWNEEEKKSRVSYRSFYHQSKANYGLGFRVVRTL